MSSIQFRTEGTRRRRRMDRRRTRLAGTAMLCAVTLLIVLFLGVSWKVLGMLRGDSGADFAGPGQGEVLLELTPGTSITSMGRELALRGVVASPGAFVRAASDEPRAARVQPGWYRLKEQMAAADAVQALLDPATRAERKVTLPEGLRYADSLRRLSEGTGLSVEALEAALAADKTALPEYAEAAPGKSRAQRAEGYLYPSTYEFAPNVTPEEVVQAIGERFDKVATRLDLADARREFTPEEIVIVASLIEAEASRDEDFGKVARVVYNRLDIDRELQFDSTVNYALNATKSRVLNKDLKVKSPYNTYANKGLPPAPINSPGEKALTAALAPTQGDWIYFVTTNLDTGLTKFTASEAEFFRFRDELARNRDG